MERDLADDRSGELPGRRRAGTYTPFGIQTEATYDWEDTKWTIPVIASVSQLFKIGGLPISLQLGPKWYAEGPTGAPDWGIRFAFIFLVSEKVIAT